jgi:hypothetical protein
MKNKILSFVSTISILLTGPAIADDICSDRPGLGSAPCTVPLNHWQIESDLTNNSWANTNGTKTRTAIYLDPTIKLGISPVSDIELQFSPIVNIRTIEKSTHGIGDMWFKYKQNLLQSDNLSIATVAMIKAPVADKQIGNGHWGGGIQVPALLTIDLVWSVSSTYEIDFLKNDQNSGTHVQLQHSVTLQKNIPDSGISLQVGLGTVWDLDKRPVRQYSLSTSVGWIIQQDWQLDAGINWGLNRAAPERVFYTGISRRF